MPESERSDDSVVITVESELVLSLNDELKSSRLSMPNRCIFETPSILLRHKENAFHPNRFSIGPMHHGKDILVAGEKIKIEYLNGLLSRVTTSRWPETNSDEKTKEIKQKEILTELINVAQSVQEKAGACYAGHDFAKELGADFAKVMVLDGCFIIELFRKNADKVTKEQDDPIFSTSCMLKFLLHDLILLENQIPWLVLQTLFDKTNLPSETKSLIELTLDFFDTTFSSNPPNIKELVDLFSGRDIKHILDLLRSSIVLPLKPEDHPISEWQSIRPITRLQEAGVKFKKAASLSVLDIRFRNGTLEIPSLLIQETTETILRNMIAYEQCLPHCPPIFTCYAMLLDYLIDTPNDLRILCKMEIYNNWLSPEQGTQFFSKLYNDTHVKEFYYSKLCEELNGHCQRWWPRWRAYLVHNYFSKPWAIATAYAFSILVLTFWQTFIKKG